MWLGAPPEGLSVGFRLRIGSFTSISAETSGSESTCRSAERVVAASTIGRSFAGAERLSGPGSGSSLLSSAGILGPLSIFTAPEWPPSLGPFALGPRFPDVWTNDVRPGSQCVRRYPYSTHDALISDANQDKLWACPSPLSRALSHVLLRSVTTLLREGDVGIQGPIAPIYRSDEVYLRRYLLQIDAFRLAVMACSMKWFELLLGA